LLNRLIHSTNKQLKKQTVKRLNKKK